MHYLSVEEVYKKLNSNPNGINEKEAQKRLLIYGLNKIESKERFKLLKIFLKQFNNLFIFLLIGASILSFFVGEILDSVLILVIIFANSILGFVQEYKSDKAIQKMKELLKQEVKVLRDGKVLQIDSTYLVPGDIIFLEAGMKVPADCRIIESFDLKVNEAILTGESFPIIKKNVVLDEDTPITERVNMVFAGTSVLNGSGKAIVVATGNKTEMGKLAKTMREEKKKELFVEEINKVSKLITKFTLLITLIILVFNLITTDFVSSILLAISLAVAVVPEGLPAVISATFAIAAMDLSKKGILIRKLSTIYSLGNITFLCIDKTGTLTKNQLEVVEEFYFGEKTKKKLMEVGYYCNELIGGMGDPVDVAVFNYSKKFEPKEGKKIGEVSFTSERKRMNVIYKFGDKIINYIKGAPEILLDLSKYYLNNGNVEKLTGDKKELFLKKINEMAKNGLKPIGLAYTNQKEEKDLVFVGVLGLLDPPRKEAKEFIEILKSSGVKIMIITGDHKLTTRYVAKMVGLYERGDLIIEGKDLQKMDDKELLKIIDKIKIVARASPYDKLRIVRLLKKKGYVVGMTGDGVNDAPALKHADVGIGMGSGSDITKEAADLVLVKDSIDTIVNGILEGRRIFFNIKKFLIYLLSANIGEVIGIFTTNLIFRTIPLKAPHILWINLVTDGLPAVAMGVDPAFKGIEKLKAKFRKFLEDKDIEYIVIRGIISGLLGLIAFYFGGTTFMFFSYVLLEMLFLVIVEITFKTNILKNRFLVFSIVSSIFITIPFVLTSLSKLLDLMPINLFEFSEEMTFLVILAFLTFYGYGKIRKVNLIE